MVGEQFYGDNVRNIVDCVFQCDCIENFQVVYVKDYVVVIGYYVLMVFWMVVQFDQLMCYGVVCYWNDFYWQWEFVQNIDLFGGVGDVDKFICD